jgi:hypothetical protein
MTEKAVPTKSIESEKEEILNAASELFGKAVNILSHLKPSLAKPYFKGGTVPSNGIKFKTEDGECDIDIKRSKIQSYISINKSTPSEWQSSFINFNLNPNGTASSADINYYDFSGLKKYTGLDAIGKVNELLEEIK